ncbi:hypothetical protein KVR01_004706 [Diaporthe batatas]|uniref:uncharacterized protein n=1 Tax=Diaporthe batatas TaxID=748121 RepID=UPI001D036534|nr:uncharacterized protein KVR01_004706 [Diaporthe batatas]KAG8166154.1 hypothetical protein KVR01_004706 [Diaporthe batatas]
MTPLQPRVNQADMLSQHETRSDDGPWCASNEWDCLNTAAQFGIIFSVIVVTLTIVWVYWYAIVRPRQERIKESGHDLELNLGDGRSITVSSGPHQRTVVLRDDRLPTPPPPAYRPPTPGNAVFVSSGSTMTTEPSRPSTPDSQLHRWYTPSRKCERKHTTSYRRLRRIRLLGLLHHLKPPQQYVCQSKDRFIPLPLPLRRLCHPHLAAGYKPALHLQVMHPPSKMTTRIVAAPYLHQAVEDGAHHQVARSSHAATPHPPTTGDDDNMPDAVLGRAPAALRDGGDGASVEDMGDRRPSLMRTDLASLLLEAEGRQRARETERRQSLVDRYDEEEGDSAHPKVKEKADGRDETTETFAATSAEQQDPQHRRQRDEARNGESGEGLIAATRRRVAFNELSPEVWESRVGRPSRRSQSPPRLPTHKDLRHGESRVGRHRRSPSPDEKVVQRPVDPVSSVAESRIGRPRPSSSTREHQARRRDSHGFPGVGESRINSHHRRKRRETYPPEMFSSGKGDNYYDTQDVNGRYRIPVDDSILDVAQSEGPPSSAGATCATRSQASSESSYPSRRMSLTPALFNRDRSRRGQEDARPHLRSSSPGESNDHKMEKRTSRSSWASKLASFLPTIARLTTNNPVVQELADDVAVEVRNRDSREQAALERPPAIARREPIGHGPDDTQRAHTRSRHAHRFPDHHHHHHRHHQRGDARRAQPRSSNHRYRRHGRRPSTIHEEPQESLQVALEHAAERLAEGAVESALDRAHHRGGGSDSREGGADVMSGEDDRCRRRPRRSKETEC